MAKRLAGFNTYGLCEFLSKKGLKEIVPYVEEHQLDGQSVAAFSEDDILQLDISEKNKKKLMKLLHPKSKALQTLGKKKKDDKSSSCPLESPLAETPSDAFTDDWGEDEFDEFDEFDDEGQEEFQEEFQDNAPAPPPPPPPVEPTTRAPSRSFHGGAPSSSGSFPPAQPVARKMSAPQAPPSNMMGGHSAPPPPPGAGHHRASMGSRSPSQPYIGCSNVNIAGYPWYNPSIARVHAEAAMRRIGMDGTFIFRNSTKNRGECTLSVLYYGNIRHLRVRLRPDGRFALGEWKQGEFEFASIPELVEFHKCEPITLQSGGAVCLLHPCAGY